MAQGGMPTEATLRAQLAAVPLPGLGDPVQAGLIDGIAIDPGGVVTLALRIPAAGPAPEILDKWRVQAERALICVPGVQTVRIVTTAERAPRPAAAQGHGHGHGAPQGAPRPAPAPLLPEVGAIIAVASGKGGVGKSTLAVNLALALAAQGKRVGLLDADIYGPSQPRMLGVGGQPPMAGPDKLAPHRVWGISVMSIGFLVPEDQATIWRGPMVMGALEQMMRDVAWGPLDIMVVDMPPGTGDAQLTMAQRVPLAGAVIVSTPQDIALLDARKGIAMFRKVAVPLLGVVENMSYYLCPNCGHRADIFGHGGAQREAERIGVPFLGAIPLDQTIRLTGDAGRPIVAADSDSPLAAAYHAIAARVADQIAAAQAAKGRQPPRIIIE